MTFTRRNAFAAICAGLLFTACQPPDPRLTNFRLEKDGVVAEYDEHTGRLKHAEADVNKNGRKDTFSYWDGTRLLRVEEDLNEDGVTERWTYLAADNRHVEKIGTSSRGDGVPDTWDLLDAQDRLTTVEKDLDRDGVVDQRYRYEDDPATPGKRVAVLAELEIDASGTPKYRVRYRPDGSVVNTETVRKDKAPTAASTARARSHRPAN